MTRQTLSNWLLIAAAVLAAYSVGGSKGCDLPVFVPPAPVVVEGPRDVLIVHESAKDTPPFGRLASTLREGTVADYLKSKGHNLLIQDPDDGSPIIKQWQAEITGATLPIVIVSDKGKLISKDALAADATAQTVLDLVKKAGG